MLAPTSRPPKYVFPWNGELSSPPTEMIDGIGIDSVLLYPAKFVCADVTVKRIPAALIDGEGGVSAAASSGVAIPITDCTWF